VISNALRLLWNYPAIWYFLPRAWENPGTPHTWRDWWCAENFERAWEIARIVYCDDAKADPPRSEP
jgi:hypothetical protein